MPLLGLMYYIGTPNEQFSKNVLVGIIFGFLGDVLLLVDDPYSPIIVFGIVSFFIGHLLYIVSFLREAGFYNYKKYFHIFLLISGIFFYGETIAFKYLKEGFMKRNVMVHGVSYLTLLAVLNITSAFYSFTYFNVYSFLTFIGSFIFFISDFILVRKMFYESKDYYQVTLMATYILAQSLICYGLAHRRNKYEYKKIY
jgi:uncharacterized membrane protein YhhN